MSDAIETEGIVDLDLISTDVAAMSDQEIDALLRRVESIADLSEICQGFTIKHGYHYFLGVFQNPFLPFVLTQYPRDWYTRYKKMDYWERDPVVSVAFKTFGGFYWDEIPMNDAGKAFFAEAAAYGVADGFSVAARGPDGAQLLLSIATNGPQTLPDGMSRRDMLMRANWFAHQALESSFRIAQSGKTSFTDAEVLLTDRERVVLAFIGKGIGAKEIARNLSISVTRVNQLLDNLKGKFAVGSREEVLVKATRKGVLGGTRFPAMLNFVDEDGYRDGHERVEGRKRKADE